MNEIVNKIELEKMGGPLYSGRKRGEANRNKFKLDSLDESKTSIEVLIPENTYSITSSFFMGLFGESVRNLGSRESFLEKYKFKMPEKFKIKFDKYIERALREKTPLI